jgi:hypothetical protein
MAKQAGTPQKILKRNKNVKQNYPFCFSLVSFLWKWQSIYAGGINVGFRPKADIGVNGSA